MDKLPQRGREFPEGRATGIPTILKELRENGSPEPKFLTDDDFTYFEVELFIHPEFAPKIPTMLVLDSVPWDLKGINQLLDQIILNTAGGIAGGIAGNQDEIVQDIENQTKIVLSALDSNQAGILAGGIAGAGIEDKFLRALTAAIFPPR